MAKSKTKTTKAPAKADAGPTPSDKFASLLGSLKELAAAETGSKQEKRTHRLRLALIDSATRVVVASTNPDCFRTAMAYLNHHYAADLPKELPAPGAPYVQTTNEDGSMTVAPFDPDSVRTLEAREGE